MTGVCCPRCDRPVYYPERKCALGSIWHTFCFSCYRCRKLLDTNNVKTVNGELYCCECYEICYGCTPKPSYCGTPGCTPKASYCGTPGCVICTRISNNSRASRSTRPCSASKCTRRSCSQCSQSPPPCIKPSYVPCPSKPCYKSCNDPCVPKTSCYVPTPKCYVRCTPPPCPRPSRRSCSPPCDPIKVECRPVKCIPSSETCSIPCCENKPDCSCAVCRRPSSITCTIPSPPECTCCQTVPSCPRRYGGGYVCSRCKQKVYQAEMVLAAQSAYHTNCFSCFMCHKPLDSCSYNEHDGEIYCKQCYSKYYGPIGYGYGSLPTLQSTF